MRTGPWLAKLRSRQAGGGLVQAFAVLLLAPAADSVQHGRPWFGVPVAAALAAGHVALLASGPLAGVRSRRVMLLVGVLGVALIAGLSIWLSRDYNEVWSVGLLMAAADCCYVFAGTRPAMCGVVVLTVVAAVTITGRAPGSAVVVFVSGAIAALRRRLLVTIDELRVARTELAEYAVIQERQRFSRDLHDLLGHSLSTIVVTAELAQRSLRADPVTTEQALADIEATGRTALGEVRSAVTGYRTLSFRDQLRVGGDALQAAGIRAAVSAAEQVWSDSVDQVLSWTARESMTNIVRHSHARNALITLTAGQTDVCLQVSDDGDAGKGGLWRAESGLRTLRERVTAGQGTLEVALGDEGGLRLTVRLPIKEAQA